MAPESARPGSLSRRLEATTRILVVEDEVDIADFLRAYFRASGYDLVHVDPLAPEDVVAALDEHRPDCVLLDFGLRGFSGDDAYRLIRREERFAFLPVVVVTADMTAGPRAERYAAGIDGFVTKPFNVNTLAGEVGERIEAARRLALVGRHASSELLNKQYLDARIQDELAIAARSSAEQLALALVHLRRIEATHGAVGPDGVAYVLRELVAFVRERLPQESVLAQTDEDDVVVLVPGMAPEDVAPVLDRALDEARRAIQLPGGADVAIDARAGLAGYPTHARTADELFMAADAALAESIDGDSRVRVAL